MSYETKQVIVCDGVLQHGEKCGRIFQAGETMIRLTLRAVRSDLPRDEYVGMERYEAEKKARLREEKHFHTSCSVPATLAGDLVAHAATVTVWPELTEDD
jgi:hypothetical protein